jgi:hypothetical protein
VGAHNHRQPALLKPPQACFPDPFIRPGGVPGPHLGEVPLIVTGTGQAHVLNEGFLCPLPPALWSTTRRPTRSVREAGGDGYGDGGQVNGWIVLSIPPLDISLQTSSPAWNGVEEDHTPAVTHRYVGAIDCKWDRRSFLKVETTNFRNSPRRRKEGRNFR